MGTVLLIGTLDTKGREVAYVRDRLVARGHRALLLDAGTYPSDVGADLGADRVAAAGGGDLAAMRERGDRGDAVTTMARGVAALTAELWREGEIDAVLGLGGSGGSTLASAGMLALPVGVPKLLLSTLASGDVSPFVGIKDVAVMYSVVDIAGLNRLSRRVLANAADMIAGALEGAEVEVGERPLIAATMFGVTTPCVTRLQRRLEAEGYDAVVFHATGSGGRAMEGLIRDGAFAAVADVTTTEWCDELVGGVLSAGRERLDAAAETGTPQAVSVGALDMVNFWGIDTVPERFRERNLYRHNANVTLMRTTADECARIGDTLAEKLSAATGPTALLLPLGGVSALDAPGQPFYDPEANGALFDALRGGIGERVRLIEIDAHINDDAFADAYAETTLDLLRGVG